MVCPEAEEVKHVSKIYLQLKYFMKEENNRDKNQDNGSDEAHI